MTIRTSEEMKRNGYLIFPFPAELSAAMKAHIFQFMGLQKPSSVPEKEIIQKLTEKSMTYADEAFTEKFSKPFRMFPESVAQIAVNWVEGLAKQLGGKRAGINYVSTDEREKNTSLRKDSFDVFWRCVRPGKPDVGAAHADYQFWELVKGTPHDVECPFDYDERWKIWVPLMGCDPTNSLEVVPGSHAQEVPIDKILTKNGYKPKIQPHWLEKYEKFFTCPLTSFGSHCVLFHDKLVHRGPPNNTPNLRMSGELTILLKL
jgi:hypothetical protein